MNRTSAIFILSILSLPIYSHTATVESRDIRIGYVDNGVSLWREPKKGFNYHVLDSQGNTVFVASGVDRIIVDGCEDEKRTLWRLRSQKVFPPSNLSSPIIVGSRSEKPFEAVQRSEFNNETKRSILNYFISSPSALSVSEDEVKYAGSNGKKSRVLVIMKENTNGNISRSRVYIGEFDGKSTKELFSYIKDDSSFRCDYEAGADLNGDGMVDVFKVNYGDYDGELLFIEENGVWRTQNDDGPGPC